MHECSENVFSIGPAPGFDASSRKSVGGSQEPLLDAQRTSKIFQGRRGHHTPGAGRRESVRSVPPKTPPPASTKTLAESESCLQFRSFEKLVQQNAAILDFFEQKNTKITCELKQSLLGWLVDRRVLRPESRQSLDRIATICRDGMIFFDLINCLEGAEVLKPVVNPPKVVRDHFMNIKRILRFLDEKFGPSKIEFVSETAFTRMFSGHETSFWLLILGLRQAYEDSPAYTVEARETVRRSLDPRTQKRVSFGGVAGPGPDSVNISKSVAESKRDALLFDKIRRDALQSQEMTVSAPKPRPQSKPRPSEDQKGTSRYSGSLQKKYDALHRSKLNKVSAADVTKKFQDLLGQNDPGHSNNQTTGTRGLSAHASVQSTQAHKAFHKAQNTFLGSVFSVPLPAAPKFSVRLTPKHVDDRATSSKHPLHPPTIGPDLNFYKIQALASPVRSFLTDLGLSDLLDGFFQKPLLEDPFRNGLAVCLVVHSALNLTIKSVCKTPKSLHECRRNFVNAVKAITKAFNSQEVSGFIEKIDQVMMGCYNIVFEFIMYLKGLAEGTLAASNLARTLPEHEVVTLGKKGGRGKSGARKTGSLQEISRLLSPAKPIVGSTKEARTTTLWAPQNPLFTEVIEWLYSEKLIESPHETAEGVVLGVLSQDLLRRIIFRCFPSDQLKSYPKTPSLIGHPPQSSPLDQIDSAVAFLRRSNDFPKAHLEPKRGLHSGDCGQIFGLLHHLKNYQRDHREAIARAQVSESGLLSAQAVQDTKFWTSKSKMFVENSELAPKNLTQSSWGFTPTAAQFYRPKIIQNCDEIIFDEKFEASRQKCQKFLEEVGLGMEVGASPELTLVPEFQNGILLKKIYDLLLTEPVNGLQFPPRNTSASKNNIKRLLKKLLGIHLDDFMTEDRVEKLAMGDVHVHAELFGILRKIFFVQIDKLVLRRNQR